MTLAEFEVTLAQDTPPQRLTAPLTALWWARRGDWEKAHRIVMDETGAEGAWVHAYLHRVEGDPGNAGYWYRQANKPAATGNLDSEWSAMVAALLE